MNRTEAADVVKESLARIVPDADLTALGPEEPFREALELDSLDFLRFIETLSERTGVRIDDADTPRLTTLSGCVGFLSSGGA
ncbi:acyl carrier protein [Streptomyces sp. NBS 14/10]|uniref:acyl carrier protein n=1 Tax=unclassified Streptomyces TaxID=2593676 RepID=UPI0015C595FD|nr:acyl carrier protein [Streptomyces sp. NBS 14/10]KAK1184469.1 acyl carrier protein [Streptomyces sp. NBS 14/10]MDW6057144.1 acyl carrier protein [Streptomyces sp. FXJ1.4098]